MVVAAGTGDRQPQEGLGDDVDLVVDPVGLVLADVDRRVGASPRNQNPVAEDRLVKAVDADAGEAVEQVAGDLLDDELVVRQVGVEGPNDVVAISKRVGDVVVELVAGAFRRNAPGRASAVPNARRNRGLASSRSTSLS